MANRERRRKREKGRLGAILLITSVCLVALHFRRGRMDMRGASRLAVFIFLIGMASWMLRCSHVPTIDVQMHQIGLAVSGCLISAAPFWLFYAAMELFVRRLWPRILISWNRVLNGQLRDLLVKHHILVGVAFGISFWLLDMLMQEITLRLDPNEGNEPGFFNYLPSLLGVRRSISGMLEILQSAIWGGLMAALLLLILRFLLRKE